MKRRNRKTPIHLNILGWDVSAFIFQTNCKAMGLTDVR